MNRVSQGGQPAGTKAGLVSVVVASYNHATYLARRMDSLLNQTYPLLEIIVIDDASPDESVSVLRQYERDSRVRLVLREHNTGWIAVSNLGLELSSGEFVLFANCDDACAPTMVERLVAAMREHPSAGIAFCRSLLVDELGNNLGDDFTLREPEFRKRCARDTLLRGAEAGKFLLRSCVIPNLSAALFRRETFSRVGSLSTEYRVCSDWDLFFRIAVQYDIAYVGMPLNQFRQHAKTIRSSTRERVVYAEYLKLLLSRIRTQPLSFVDRMRFRMHAMYLWMTHAIQFGRSGFRDVPVHSKIVWTQDPVAFILLPAAVCKRVLRIMVGPFRRSCGDEIVN